ncbi:hypothetical protein A7X75_06500 [Stenotrophomonas maltophilia]|nr:hypothetical protein A7X75_06500 [Stenotrophomonas maltophilia]
MRSSSTDSNLLDARAFDTNIRDHAKFLEVFRIHGRGITHTARTENIVRFLRIVRNRRALRMGCRDHSSA